MVRLCAGHRMPIDEIASAIMNPATNESISKVTLLKHFRKEIDSGYANLKARLVSAKVRSAEGVLAEDGKSYLLNPNVTAQIWLDKTLYGIRENVAVGVPAAATLGDGADDVTLDNARRVAFMLSLGAEIADKKAAAKPKKA